MASKKAAGRATTPTETEEPSKAELQRRMEEAREDISQTVEEIKDTVTESYEAVKETVVETLDWRAQFRKHSVAMSLGALAIGYIVGSGLAASLDDATPKKKGRKPSGLLDEIYAFGEKLSDEFSGIADTILLPALSKKIKDNFGVDISDRLPSLRASKTKKSLASKSSAKKSSSKKAAGKKSSAKKGSAKKRAPGKRAAKKSE
jgi:hypothetical protein